MAKCNHREEIIAMTRNKYTPEFKAKVVIEVIQGDRELEEIASLYNLNPNMLRNWKRDFIQNANRVFNESQTEKEISRKEAILEQEREKMLKTIGQLTLERDFLQDVFRRNGYPVPILQDRSKR